MSICSAFVVMCRLHLHTLMVTAAVQQDFAESILERGLQTSARAAVKAKLLVPVADVIEAATIVELADPGISSCLASYKALLVGLKVRCCTLSVN